MREGLCLYHKWIFSEVGDAEIGMILEGRYNRMKKNSLKISQEKAALKATLYSQQFIPIYFLFHLFHKWEEESNTRATTYCHY